MKSKYLEPSDSISPEIVLQQYVVDLENSVDQMSIRLITLRKSIERNEKVKSARQLHVEADALLEYIYSIMGYLRKRQKKSGTDTIQPGEDSKNIAEGSIRSLSADIILSRFSNELRHPLTAIAGFADYYQKSQIVADEQQDVENSITETVELVKQMCLQLRNELVP